MGRARAMKRMSRMPRIGDALIVSCRNDKHVRRCDCHDRGEKHVGIVTDIKHDSWGHQRNVMVEWSTDSPCGYNVKHGYSGVNIHNLREVFTLIRNGVNIP